MGQRHSTVNKCVEYNSTKFFLFVALLLTALVDLNVLTFRIHRKVQILRLILKLGALLYLHLELALAFAPDYDKMLQDLDKQIEDIASQIKSIEEENLSNGEIDKDSIDYRIYSDDIQKHKAEQSKLVETRMEAKKAMKNAKTKKKRNKHREIVKKCDEKLKKLEGDKPESFMKFARAEYGKKVSLIRYCNHCDVKMCSWKGCPYKKAWYCNKECQKAAWSDHKASCNHRNSDNKVK